MGAGNTLVLPVVVIASVAAGATAVAPAAGEGALNRAPLPWPLLAARTAVGINAADGWE